MSKFKLKDEEKSHNKKIEITEDDEKWIKRMQIENYLNFIISFP